MAKAARRGLVRIVVSMMAGVLVLGSLAAAIPARKVVGDAMLWTVKAGDIVWIVPDRVRKADVVLVDDPLDPGKRVLRRVVAIAGEKVRVDDSGLRVNGKRIRQTEMGDRPGLRIRKEVIWSRPPARANPYFTQLTVPEVPWSSQGVVEVPEGHWYVLADNRDSAVDSRWWGPVPDSAIHGVVRARYGEVDTWRETPWAMVLPEE